MFPAPVRLVIIVGCLAYGGYQLANSDSSGGWLLLAAAILSIGHFRRHET